MLENSLTTDYREAKRVAIDDYELPKTLNRFGAAALDLALFVLLSFLILTIMGLFVGKEGSKLASANGLISEHIGYSKLAKYEEKNGYVSYSNDDLLSLTDNDESFIIDRLSYFYCSYLTGAHLEEENGASLEKNEPFVINGISYLPSDYYTVTYFNENILGLPKEGQENESKFFLYKDEDRTQIGIVNPSYIEEVVTSEGKKNRLKNDNELLECLSKMYNNAIKVFYNQKSIKEATKVINNINTMVMFVSTIPSFIIFYLVIPLCSPFGKTLGKRFLSLAVVTDQGYLVKKWQLLLRAVPLLGAIIYICLINSLYYQFILPLLLILISTGIVVFTNKRKALHDLMAATVVIKMNKETVVYKDEDSYHQALEIMKARSEAHHE